MKHKKKLAGGGLVAAIALIVTSVISVEGGYVNHPSDPGGATKFGVTERVARANGYKGRMQDMTREQARKIYAGQYIGKTGFDGIIALDKDVGKKVVDIGVNAGPNRAARWFQLSLNQYNRRQRDYKDIAVDGDIGPASIRAFEALQRKRGVDVACQLMLRKIEGFQAEHYSRLAGTRNGRFEDFQIGWFRTRVGNVECS